MPALASHEAPRAAVPASGPATDSVSRVGFGLGAAILAGLLAPGSLLVAMIGAARASRGSAIAWWSAALLVVSFAVFVLARRSTRFGAGVVAAGGLLGVLPTVFFGALWSWAQPIVAGGWDFCGTGDVGLVILGLPLTGLFATVGVLIGLAVVRRQSARPDGVLGPILGGAAFFATAALAAFLASLAPTDGRPEADAWPARVPVVTTLRFAGEGPAFTGTTRHWIGDGVLLQRECAREDAYDGPRSRCSLRLLRVLGAPSPGSISQGPIGAPAAVDVATQLLGSEAHSITVAAGEPLEVAHDAAHDLWLVRPPVGGHLAFDRAGATEIGTFELGRAIAVPSPTFAAGVVGLALALLALLVRVTASLRARALRRGREGRVDAHGIAFDDGELPARGALAGPAPEGPAVAYSSAGPAGYRDDGTRGAWRVTSGSRAELLERLRWQRLGADALALAVALVALTPLLVTARTLSLLP